MRPADTSPEAWEVYLAIQRRLTPAEKFQQVMDLSAAVQRAAEDDLRRRYPQAGERELFLRAVRQRLGPDLFRAAYGNELDAYESARPATETHRGSAGMPTRT